MYAENLATRPCLLTCSPDAVLDAASLVLQAEVEAVNERPPPPATNTFAWLLAEATASAEPSDCGWHESRARGAFCGE